ncbi:MAG: heavy metal translocating P-type ATPase [Formosimonas sp.]
MSQFSPRTTDIHLRLGGVACVACTDLIERDVAQVAGVARVQANYTLRRAFLTVDLQVVSVAQIIERIEKLGYHAYPEQANETSAEEKKQLRTELFRLLTAWFVLMQSMMFMYPFYFAGAGDMDARTASLMRWANFALTVPIVLFCARPIFSGAWAEWRLRRLGMDTPVTLAIVIALVSSVYATVSGRGEIYYDSIIMFVALLLGARYVQFKALNRAAGYLNTVLRHKTLFAEKVANYPADKQTALLPASELAVGDVVFVASGETVPADARVLDGTTTCSQALLTGESLPIHKTVGDAVLAGSVNIEQAIYAQITAARGASQLDAIEQLAQQSALHKPAIAQLAETAARYFLYILLLVCAGAAGYWWLHDASRIVPIVVAILIITCPCALALAVPTVLTAASSALARRHVLLIRPEALEQLARVNLYAFDKTGTLTEDVQTLQHTLADSPDAMLQIAATLEAASRHPIALALRKALQERGLPERMDEVESLELVVGQGVVGQLAGEVYRVGKPSFAAGRDLLADEFPSDTDGRSIALLCNEAGEFLAWFVLCDQTRALAAPLVAQLQREHCEVQLISGDKADVVQDFAAQLNIATAHANATPERKLQLIQELQKRGKVVAMTGDGLNDAAVLQQADVAIAMGHGSSLTQLQADMVVQSGDLADIYAAHTIAQRTRRLMRQNLGWAVVYNLVAIPLAATGHVTPLIASIGMAVSSLIVVGNALRILRPTPNLG